MLKNNKRDDIASCSSSPKGIAAPFSPDELRRFNGDTMPANEEKTPSSLKAAALIGRPAQLYEFHEATGEEHKHVGLAQWLRSVPPRTLLVAAKDIDSALTYLAANMPDFEIKTVTPRGSVFTVMERQ